MRGLSFKLLLTLVVLTNCQLSESSYNELPVLHEIRYFPKNPTHLTTIQLQAIATDADGDSLSFSWFLQSGYPFTELDNSLLRWEPTTVGNHEITCSVSDGMDTISSTIIIPVAESRSFIMGHVFDKQTGQILPGVAIEIEGNMTESDSLGSFRVEDLPRKVYVEIRANHSEYELFSVQYYTNSEGHIKDIEMRALNES